MQASFIAHCKAKYLHRWERFQSNCHLNHKSMEYLLPLHNPGHISRCILVGRSVVFARIPLVLLNQKPVVVELDTCELRKWYSISQKRCLLNCFFVCFAVYLGTVVFCMGQWWCIVCQIVSLNIYLHKWFASLTIVRRLDKFSKRFHSVRIQHYM